MKFLVLSISIILFPIFLHAANNSAERIYPYEVNFVDQKIGLLGTSTTSSITYIPLENMSSTITVTGESKVYINFSGTFANDTVGAYVSVQVYIDGAFVTQTQRGSYTHVSDRFCHLNTNYIASLSAGTHVVDIYWTVTAGIGTSFLNQRILNIIELKK